MWKTSLFLLPVTFQSVGWLTDWWMEGSMRRICFNQPGFFFFSLVTAVFVSHNLFFFDCLRWCQLRPLVVRLLRCVQLWRTCLNLIFFFLFARIDCWPQFAALKTFLWFGHLKFFCFLFFLIFSEPANVHLFYFFSHKIKTCGWTRFSFYLSVSRVFFLNLFVFLALLVICFVLLFLRCDADRRQTSGCGWAPFIFILF